MIQGERDGHERNGPRETAVSDRRYASRVPDAVKVRAKTLRPGGGLRSRWRTEDGRILERDRLHDTVEVYDRLAASTWASSILGTVGRSDRPTRPAPWSPEDDVPRRDL
jgi:hypothetical protein